MLPALKAWGWTPRREVEFAAHAAAGFVPGRVFGQERGSTRAMTADGPMEVVIQRGFRRSAFGTSDFPAVGDWLALEPLDTPETAALRSVLPRTSAFARGQADGGGRLHEQILAANIDTVLLVAALTRDFNIRRLERYLALAGTSGARAVIVLNKADLADDIEARVADVAGIAGASPIHAISARTGTGLEALDAYLGDGQTVALLGSSGVGKSTISNALLGSERQLVRDVREDDHRGRHTTTTRELFPLPAGALLIDTPGLRRIGLWESEDGIDTTFADIDDVAAACRFADCRHDVEPGCAVRAAIESGDLAGDRLASRRKLEAELRSIERRSSVAASRAESRRFGKMIRNSCKAQARARGRDDY